MGNCVKVTFCRYHMVVNVSPSDKMGEKTLMTTSFSPYILSKWPSSPSGCLT